ncbi:type VI secretion system protein TssA [Acanthopleuribacter pedis]|uniref:Type VI secretion system protein TssA n=1 Tax=Acanthopleuribacter pedis TaxID=442870 RepID=A0A8J7QN56_9BACT|nr:type VI secretion system protein TssA [Acanthopleuribacter pedis]MBO1321070.1 type VI secretion system protein TssA [Acanthopleuribacter pedis]
MTAVDSTAWSYDHLLKPISEQEPAGINLRYEPIYDDIREAQREDDLHLPRGDWETELKRADWREVCELCEQALGAQSKDLRVAAWLVEALLKNRGPAAAACGVHMLREISLTFWKEAFPQDEDEDYEARLDLCEWLDRRLHLGVLHYPLFALEAMQPVSLSDWERVVKTRNADHKDGLPEGEIDPAAFDKALKATATADLRALQAGFAALGEAVDHLETSLDELMGRAAPSFKTVRDMLELLQRRLAEPLATRHDGLESDPEPEEASTEAGGESGVLSMRGAIQSRDQAYQLITKIADFLEATEPHSPTPYLLRRVADWGNKSLVELMQETITSQDERSRYMTHFFLPIPEEPKQDSGW